MDNCHGERSICGNMQKYLERWTRKSLLYKSNCDQSHNGMEVQSDHLPSSQRKMISEISKKIQVYISAFTIGTIILSKAPIKGAQLPTQSIVDIFMQLSFFYTQSKLDFSIVDKMTLKLLDENLYSTHCVQFSKLFISLLLQLQCTFKMEENLFH